jgi:YD repeat-containing protein
MLNRNGVSRVTWHFDDRARLAEATFLGTDDRPKENVNGVARVTYTYDERGNRTEHAFRADGKPR